MIKSVQKADTIQCKDAVTKEALKAVLSVSHDASYGNIDIHNVKSANVLKAHTSGTVCAGRKCSNISARKAAANRVHTDMPGYKDVNYNLTIDELFSGTGRNFR